jgi:hypothetical protein
MVSTEVTQNSPQSSSDSVRITAETRRQVEIELLTRELTRQQIVVASECNDLKVLKSNGSPCAMAERRASNATAVLQHLGSMLRARGGNRDFVGQVAK